MALVRQPWLLLVVGATISGCTKTEEVKSANIGIVLPLTGTFAAKGEVHENAVRMALEDLQEAGIEEAIGMPVDVVPFSSGPGVDPAMEDIQGVIDELTDDSGRINMCIASAES